MLMVLVARCLSAGVRACMLADSAILHKTPMQIALFGVVELTVVLTVACLAKRARQGELSFTRVAWLTAASLATSLPFAFVAYILWPWDLDLNNVRLAVGLALPGAFFAPFITAFMLVRRVSRTRRHAAHDAQTNTQP